MRSAQFRPLRQYLAPIFCTDQAFLSTKWMKQLLKHNVGQAHVPQLKLRLASPNAEYTKYQGKKSAKKAARIDRKSGMRVAIEGCCHGELDKIYAAVQQLEKQQSKKIDLLICCGDFQALRNMDDLRCLACPPKHRRIGDFYKYYSGEVEAPYPTIFIGGNHEACNHLWELYYGGWVAPRIYYMGHAGVVNFGGVRIGGLSGIFNGRHYSLGHFERPPYTESTMRSAYHVRELEVYRLSQLKQPLDIMLSHDWPNGIAFHGNVQQLFNRKPFLKDDIEKGVLGSPPAMQLMTELQPKYWFSAHHHTKFPALVKHPPKEGDSPKGSIEQQLAKNFTNFLALDKCLPGRRYLQLVDFPEASGPMELSYDEEWLAVLSSTHNLLSLTKRPKSLPGFGGSRGEVTEEALTRSREALERIGSSKIPENFTPTASFYSPSDRSQRQAHLPEKQIRNPQTVQFLEMLGLSYNLDPATPLLPESNPEEILLEAEGNPEEIELEDDFEGGSLEEADHGTPEDETKGSNPENICLLESSDHDGLKHV